MSDENRVNIPLLRKAVEWAEAEAMRGPEGNWCQADYRIPAGRRQIYGLAQAPDCGTAYCIAGWVAQSLDARYAEMTLVDKVHVENFAASALGIPVGDLEDSDYLFAPDNTIEDVRRIAEEIAGESL